MNAHTPTKRYIYIGLLTHAHMHIRAHTHTLMHTLMCTHTPHSHTWLTILPIPPCKARQCMWTGQHGSLVAHYTADLTRWVVQKLYMLTTHAHATGSSSLSCLVTAVICYKCWVFLSTTATYRAISDDTELQHIPDSEAKLLLIMGLRHLT